MKSGFLVFKVLIGESNGLGKAAGWHPVGAAGVFNSHETLF